MEPCEAQEAADGEALVHVQPAALQPTSPLVHVQPPTLQEVQEMEHEAREQTPAAEALV